MHRLHDKTAIVTGAASGIGLAIANRLAAEGVNLLVTDIDGERLKDVAAELRSHGTDVEPATLDVRDPYAVLAAAEQCIELFGGLNIAVNNAGIVNGGPAWELTLEDWHQVLDVNLWGVIHGVRAFVPRILATGEGHVINVASMAAVNPVGGIAPYTVAKHGVLGLSDVLRLDLASIGAPIGVSTVFPGMIRTGMNPIGTVEPATVAANVIDAIQRQRPYVFTDDHSRADVRTRLEAIIGARDDVIEN